MSKVKHIRPLTLLFFLIAVAACSKSSDQKKFEDQAFSEPSGIKEMTAEFNPVPDRNDPDDWRISPMYQGFITVNTPAAPNPVNLNGSFQIELDIIGIESVPGLAAYAFQDPERLVDTFYRYDQGPVPPGPRTINLTTSQLTNSISQPVTGLHRILILDGRNNVITYGDVRVE